MADAASADFAAQIAWGRAYVAENFGPSSGAWEHNERDDWYERGARREEGDRP